MKKLLILVALVAGAMMVTGASTAKADHNCWGGGYGGYYSGYSYAPVYSYGYAPVYSYGYSSYGYPSSGFYYSRPGFNLSIGSGYRGWGRGYYGGHHHHHGYGGGHRHGGHRH